MTVGATAGCGDYRPLGGPLCTSAATCINEPGDLTGTVYGADRTGGSISWIARDQQDHGTLWAATSAGRIFVTHNADAPTRRRSSGTGSTAHATSPTRFPSGIYVDPAELEPRLGHVLGLQRRHADHPRPRVQRDRARRARLGHVHQPERRERHVGLPDAVLGR